MAMFFLCFFLIFLRFRSQNEKKQKTVQIDLLKCLFGHVKINSLYLAASFTRTSAWGNRKALMPTCSAVHGIVAVCRFGEAPSTR